MQATGSGLSPPTVAENPPCCAAWRAPWKRAKVRSPDPEGLTVGYVEQNMPEALMDRPFYAAVLEMLSADQRLSERWRVDVALESLEVPEALRQRPLKHLSGGWQRLATLARVLVTEADVLLLDEPTNHLDLARIGQLENWLNALPREMPIVISSHDRAFLDATTNRTLFLRPEQSQVFSLPYTRARAALREADASDQRRYQRDLKAAQQLRQHAAKLNNIAWQAAASRRSIA